MVIARRQQKREPEGLYGRRRFWQSKAKRPVNHYLLLLCVRAHLSNREIVCWVVDRQQRKMRQGLVFRRGFTAKTAAGSFFLLLIIRHILLLLLFGWVFFFFRVYPLDKSRVWRQMASLLNVYTRRRRREKGDLSFFLNWCCGVFFSTVPLPVLTQPAEADGCFYGPVH